MIDCTCNHAVYVVLATVHKAKSEFSVSVAVMIALCLRQRSYADQKHLIICQNATRADESS